MPQEVIAALGLTPADARLRGVYDDGSALCIEIGTPMWGEGPAGNEWNCTFAKRICAIGLRMPSPWSTFRKATVKASSGSPQRR